MLVRALKDLVVALDARALESVGRNWPKIASYSANPHDGALFLREPRSIKGPARPRLIRARASLGEIHHLRAAKDAFLGEVDG